MDLESIILESMYESYLSDIISTGTNLAAAAGVVLVFAAIAAIFCFVVKVAFTGAMLTRLSHKLNVYEKEVLAYIPFVRDFYRMRMAGFHPALGIFLKETGIAVTLIVAKLIDLIAKNSVVYAIIVIAGIIVSCYFNYRYYNKVLKDFGFEGTLALLVFIPALDIVLDVIGMIIAFSDKFENRAAQNLTSRIHSCETELEKVKEMIKGGAKPDSRTTPVVKATVLGTKGKYSGSKFEIGDGESVIIGRDPAKCNIVYDDKCSGISRNHCTIRYSAAENGFYVTDDSSNGTFINGTLKIGQRNTKKVEKGTIICLGDESNAFRLG